MKRLTFIFVILGMMVHAQSTRLVPLHYPTIQAAIIAADSGDIVLVSPGIYYEQINFLGKSVIVSSHYMLELNPAYIANTIIDGSLLPIHNSSVVLFESGEDTTSVLNGFTIRNGRGSIFQNIYLIGGGVKMLNSGGKIMNNVFVNNVLDGILPMELVTGGAAIATQIDTASNWIVIMNNTFTNNHCKSHRYDAAGAAIISFSNTRLINNVITNNTTESNGLGSSFAAVFVKSAFTPPNNILIASGNEITHNITTSHRLVRGSGMLCSLIHATVTNNIISYNNLQANWGGVSYGGAGIYFEYPLSANIYGNTFHNNIADGYGGALYLRGNVDVNFEVHDNYFTGNQSDNGGAIYTYRAPATFVNNVFRNNASIWSSGGAIYLNSAEPNIVPARLINNSFSGNKAVENGGAVFVDGVDAYFINSIFWNDSAVNGNEIRFWNRPGNIAYCDIDTAMVKGPCTFGMNNMCCNPDFCDSTLAILYDASMCVNAGTPSYTFAGDVVLTAPDHDIRSYPRPLGGSYDMGAYEASGVGVLKHPSDNEFIVYPNPFTDQLTLSFNLQTGTTLEAELFDLSGRKIQSLYSSYEPAGQHTVTLKPSFLPMGVYTLKLNAGGKIFGIKVLK